jgi:hypothetical protein
MSAIAGRTDAPAGSRSRSRSPSGPTSARDLAMHARGPDRSPSAIGISDRARLGGEAGSFPLD